MRYHPRIGFTYMPSTKLRVQGMSGGYLVRTNASGFRSDREFVPARTPGRFRALLFGDSQTAGDGVSNAQRYGDLLEEAVPGLEIYNYGVSGSGTDQHYLTYCDFGSAVEHDLLVIGLFVENIRRLRPRILLSRDINGELAYRPKPYYELGPDGLELHNVPVPKQAWASETLPPELLPHVYTYGSEYSLFRHPAESHVSFLRALIPHGPLRTAAKAVLSRVRRYDPVPEYASAHSAEWRLMRELLKTWIRSSPTPVLLVLLPHETALLPKSHPRHSDPRCYQARFRELAAATGCLVYDPLPDLLKHSEEDRASFNEWAHLSVKGHASMARVLGPVLRQLAAGRVDARVNTADL